jgi:hypothetical protein
MQIKDCSSKGKMNQIFPFILSLLYQTTIQDPKRWKKGFLKLK